MSGLQLTIDFHELMKAANCQSLHKIEGIGVYIMMLELKLNLTCMMIICISVIIIIRSHSIIYCVLHAGNISLVTIS